MRVLIAPDKFKGSCTALAAAESIARGFRGVWPDAELQIAPIADGGEGFAETIHGVCGGEWVVADVADPLGRGIAAKFLWLSDRKTAVVNVSEASGLWRVLPKERRPTASTSFGTGQLMHAAIALGAETILVGLGGSATTDGGIGIAEALGFELRYGQGSRQSRDLATIERPAELRLPTVIAATDVQNPLLGTRGAARVFSPQKGASPAEVEALEEGLAHVANVVARDLGTDFREQAGAGAAGGIGFGLLAFCNAELRSGFDVIAEFLGLEQAIRGADLVVTGEGRMDGQTLEGKGPAGVARLARREGKPVIAFAGSVEDEAALGELFDLIAPIIAEPVSLEEAMRRGEEFLERAAARVGRSLQLGGRISSARGH